MKKCKNYCGVNEVMKKLEVQGKYVHCDIIIEKDCERYDTDCLAIAITTGEVVCE